MLGMAYRTSPRSFRPVAFCENKAALQTFGRYYMEISPFLIKRFLYMFEVPVYLFFRYPDFRRYVFGGDRRIFLHKGYYLLSYSAFSLRRHNRFPAFFH